MKKTSPSMDAWIKEAKQQENSPKIGMYLFHNGIVRSTAKKMVREGDMTARAVNGMNFFYDQEKVDELVKEAYGYEGIYYVRVWLNEGELEVGDDIMFVLIGGDIRPHVVDALQKLVGRIKNECVKEIEITE